MRNLKKVLTLVLTLAMLLSVMVVGAGAATFGDQESITNKEAVDICSALNIIGGYEDGTFRPTGNVTRAEMSKMICVALNGGKEPTMGSNLIATFNDVASTDWSAPYIEYCVSQGIVAGVGGGNFNPTGNITGTQAAKMLLCILGYNASIQGYVGDDYWETNINVDAAQKHLYDGLENIDASAALTRDQAAQMIWNALQAYEVEYNTTLVTGPNGELTSKVTVQDKVVNAEDNKKITLLKDKYEANVEDSAILTGVSPITSGANKGTFSLAIDGVADTYIKVKDSYIDLLGQSVKVVDKTDSNGNVTVFGVYATEENTVVSGLVKDIESVSADKIKVDGTEYKLDSTLSNITDGDWGSGIGLTKDTDSFDTFKLIDNNGNDKYDVAVITNVTADKVTYASSSEIIVDGITYKYADDNIESGIAKDDYVTIVKNIVTDCNDINKVSAVSGKIDGSRAINSEDCVRIDGNWYVKNGETIAVEDDCTFYAVNGVIISGSATTSTASINNLIMVLKADDKLLSTEALVMDANGVIKTVNIDSSGAPASDETMYTFTETEKGYKLTAAASIGTGPDYDYAWGTGNITKDGGKLDQINSKAVSDTASIFVKCNDGGMIITGKQFKNLTNDLNATPSAAGEIKTASAGYYTSTSNGLERVVYAGIIFNGNVDDLSVSNGNTNYGYIVGETTLTASNQMTYRLWTGTENVTVTEKSNDTANRTTGTVITYDSIDNGVITGVTKIPLSTLSAANAGTGSDGPAYISGFENDLSYIYLNGAVDTPATKYKTTDDTVYMYIDSSESGDDIGKSEIELQTAQNFGSIYRDNVIAVINNSGELELLIVDVKNDMTTNGNATRTATAPSIANANVSLSKTSDIKRGDTIVITVTATGNVTGASLTLAGCTLIDGSTTSLSYRSMASGETATYTVVADGTSDVSFS